MTMPRSEDILFAFVLAIMLVIVITMSYFLIPFEVNNDAFCQSKGYDKGGERIITSLAFGQSQIRCCHYSRSFTASNGWENNYYGCEYFDLTGGKV